MDWRPIFCGLCFGIYPILASRSRLSSGATFSILSVVMIIFAIVPFLSDGLSSIKTADSRQILTMVVGALASVAGVIVMFRYLDPVSTPIERAGGLVMMMVIMQVVATWATASSFARTLPTGKQGLGVACAIGAILLLQK